ncbi:MAG: hypothetical protein J5895_02980 [Alphaproteobacteria bacterium]|nr:hypothetical protein [Alphaproteobacteria bacterium]
MTIQKQIKKMLGRILFEERQKNNTSMAACCRALKTSPAMYERLELGLDRVGWINFEAALKYFHKSIEIRLVDEPRNNKNSG